MKKILTTICAGAIILAFAAPTVWACPSRDTDVQVVEKNKDKAKDKQKVVKKQKDKAKKKDKAKAKKKPA